MTLETRSSYLGLPVCERCGWAMAGQYEQNKHEAGCPYVKAGKSATALADRIPDVSSTKFGRGVEALTFDIDEHLHIHFRCSNTGTFDLRTLWILGELTEDEAAALVETIAEWRKTAPKKKGRLEIVDRRATDDAQ